MRKISLTFLLLLSSYLLSAQNEVDALRYSFLTHGGSARYTGMSGAFGALGADFSSLSTNPAGIGTFKTSRFMFSPIFILSSADADYRGQKTDNDKISFNLNNLGLILNLKSYDEDDSGWKSVAFGIGYNRLKNFNSEVTIRGYNDNSSMLDQFVINSHKTHPDNFYDYGYLEPSFHAYNTYLTDVDLSDTLYFHPWLGAYDLDQEKRIKTRGGISEMVFSLGGNYADKFQIGASFGIQNIRYIEKSEYTEISGLTELSSYTFSENLETKGVGYNFKLGVIYRLNNFARFGLAFHTPTFYKLKDIYSYSIGSTWNTPDDDGNYEYFSDTEAFNGDGLTENEYTYELYTPWRVVTSAAFVIARYGIISADYEYVDYSRARLRGEDYNFDTENDAIKSSYNAGHNFRLGTEIRLAPLYLRGGVSYYGSPFSKSLSDKNAIKGYSFGIGLKSENVYVDVAFNHSYYDKDYQLYQYHLGPEDVETARLSLAEDYINFTIGFKF
jgi:hypothetical protein